MDNLVARSDQATLRMSCRGAGWEPRPPTRGLQMRQLELDRQLFNVLPVSLQDQWYKYQPRGRVDARLASLDYDGRAWKPAVRWTAADLSFSHHKFNYRLEHGRGTLQLQDDRLTVNLAGLQRQSARAAVDAEMWHPANEPYGWMEAQGEELPLDEKLLAALPDHSARGGPQLGPARHGRLRLADVARRGGEPVAPASAC